MLKQHHCKQVATYAQSDHTPNEFECKSSDLPSAHFDHASAQSEFGYPYISSAQFDHALCDLASSAPTDLDSSDLASAQFDDTSALFDLTSDLFDLASAQSEFGYPCVSSALACALCDFASAQYNSHSAQTGLPCPCHPVQEQMPPKQTHAPMLQATLSSFGFHCPIQPYGLGPSSS